MVSESDGRLAAAAEVAAILLLFAACGAWSLPDVNETVYLTKALHHVDPTYGRGDWFLETPDAHSVFYAGMGPILAACGLETGAWVGRWLGWLALAVAASRIRWFCTRCRGSIPSSTRTLRANARVSSNGCGAVAALTASNSRWR